ncbi:MAG: hypothetical protein J0H18_11660 [Rhizobiales bacterium]|nr:hypothetical protein [Hyphomicrobiales bacterium]OJX98553.1 MAG: hypothetical protein BGP07_10710 [Rhizobiales bacterium 63-22]
MIQSALFFLLGVLVAVFAVVLLGPTVWRRAFFLARRQVQAELPMTLAEIRADKDGLRAEYAVALSRLEQQLRLAHGVADERMTDLGRAHEELKRIKPLEAARTNLERQLTDLGKRLAETETARDTALEKADILQAELERMQNHQHALEGLADTLRIEISGHQAESGRLLTEINAMRHDRKETASRHNEVSAALTAAQAELKSEKRRNGDLQQKLERLMAELSDTQEKLERHSRSGKALSLEDGGQEDRAEIVRQNAALREEMAALAARVVAVTAEKEGPDSPIHALVQEAGSTADAEQGDKAGSKSLATRIRDLSKA